MRDLLAAFFALILASVAGFIGAVFGGDYVGPVAFFCHADLLRLD
jgi:hypothetical protein